MLKNILSGKDCAKCRICCIFDNYDLWETPVVSDELYEKLRKERPEIGFIERGGSHLFRCVPENTENGELFYCPVLDRETGCTLGDEKPFDCRIWPYRIMELNGARVISIASICPEMYKKPLSELVNELERNGLAEIIFAEAEKNPDIVKPYQEGYPILKVKINNK